MDTQITPTQQSDYKLLADNLPGCATFLLDVEQHILLASGRALRKLFPTNEDNITGLPLNAVWPEYLFVTAAPHLEAVAAGAPQTWTAQTYNRVLSFEALSIAATPGQSLIFVRDITPTQRLIENLRSDAARYKAIVEDNHELLCRFTQDGVLTFANNTLCKQVQRTPADLIGTSFFRLCLERDVPQLRQTIRQLSSQRPDAALDMRLRSYGGPQRWIRWSFHAISDAGGNIAEVQSVGYDITETVRAHVAEKKQHDLTVALRNIASVLNNTLDLNQVLEHIIDIIGLVVRHDTVNVMLVDEHYAQVVRGKGYAAYQIKGVLSLRLRIPRTPHLRYMLETRHELVIPDLSLHTSPCLDVPELCWVESYVGAPIISDGKVIGFLNLESSTPGYFSPQHAQLVRAFADTAATAIRNAQLFDQARHAAVIEEKQRLARELHDAVSQTLFSANMIADALPLMFEKRPDAIPDQLRLLRQQTQLAMAELRAMLFELRPQALADTDIKTLLERLIQAFASRTLMDVSLSIIGDQRSPLDLTLKVTLYRIAQEAINNAIQHAEASEAEVTLKLADNAVSLCVTDNGRGFDLNRDRPGHMGLRIMRERAEAIGARITITSQIQQGTSIIVTWQAEGNE